MVESGKDKSAAGFTLIEVLVAFAILSVAFAAAYRTVSGSLTGSRSAADHSRAVLLAQSRLEAAGLESPLELGRTNGREGAFAWSIETRAHPPPKSAPRDAIEDDRGARAKEITVTISWKDGHADKSLSLKTLRLLP